MQPNSETNRRRGVRVPLDATVRAEKIPQPSPNRTWLLLPEDIGEGGLRLSSPELFPVESRLLLDIDTEAPGNRIRAVGIVAWVAPAPHQNQWHLGIAFLDVSGSGRARLRSIVRQT